MFVVVKRSTNLVRVKTEKKKMFECRKGRCRESLHHFPNAGFCSFILKKNRQHS